MTKSEVIAHFGTVDAVREALGLRSVQAIYQWPENGIPAGRQFQLQVLTKGRLKAAPAAPKTAA